MNPNDIKTLMNKIQNVSKKHIINEYVGTKELTMRDMMKRARKLNEDADIETQQPRVNLATDIDQKRFEDEMNAFFENMNVNIIFEPLEIYKDLVWAGGTLDSIIQFVYKVTPEESTSGVEFNYLPQFDRGNPDNEKIIALVESYYDSFYRTYKEMLEN